MKLTFKTKGNIEIDYRVWLDNSEKEVEKATLIVIWLWINTLFKKK